MAGRSEQDEDENVIEEFFLGEEEIVTDVVDFNEFELLQQPNRKKQRIRLLACCHPGEEHFSRRYVEDSMKANQVSIVMNPPMKSIVWAFCGCPEIDARLCSVWIICTVCERLFLFNENATSGAKRHIETKHADILATVRDGSASSATTVEDFRQLCMPSTEHKYSFSTSGVKHESGIVLEEGEYRTDEDVLDGASAFMQNLNPPVYLSVFDQFAEKAKAAVSAAAANSRRSTLRLPKGGPSFSGTQCLTCDIDFRHIGLAMMHHGVHGPDASFQCAQCRHVMKNVFEFWAHLHSRACTNE